MSGVSVERPHSKSILTVFTLVCFGLFSVGLALTLQTLGVTPDRAFVFMAFLMAVFLASLGVAFRSGRFYFASYRWTFWVALVVPALLITRVTAFFDAGAEVVRTPGTIGFLYGLLDLTSFLLAGLLAVVWIAGMRIARAIELLHPQVSEVPPSAQSPAYYDWLTSRARYIDRAMVMGELTQMAVIAGVILVGITAIDVAAGAAAQNDGLIRAALTIMVLYFVSVMLLLSYASLVRQTSQWSLELASQAPDVTGTWIRTSLVILGLALGLALLLPAIETELFAEVGKWLLGLMFRLVQVAALIGLGIVGLLTRVFELCRPRGDEAATPPPEPAATERQTGGGLISATELIGGLIALLIAGIAAVMLYRTLPQRYSSEPARAAVRAAGRHTVEWVRRILLVLLGFLLWTHAAATALRDEAVRLVRRSGPATGTRRHRLLAGRPKRPARQQIHRIYAATVAEVARFGVQRGPADTPGEFQRAFAQRCPASSDVETLTALFVRARYMPEDVPSEAVARAAACRGLIARALRQARS